MKILFITARFPYPPLKGDQVRSYNQIRILSQKHSIILFSLIGNRKELDHIPMLKRFCSHIEVVELRPFHSYLNIISGLFSPLPLQTCYYYSPELGRRIRTTIENDKFDVVHVQLIRMAPYLTHFVHMPKVIDLIDALSLNMKRRYECDRGIFKLGTYIEWQRLKKYETEICNQFDQAIVVSPTDRKAIGPFQNLHVNPNGVDTDAFPFVLEGREPFSIIFSGNMGYFPNVDAVHWFSQEVFPLIKARIPQIKFYVVGADPLKGIRRLSADERIIVTGFVDNIYKYLARATVAVCPIRSGSGIQNKVLEAMSSGTPVVATSYAVEGIQATPEEEIIIADNPVDFAQRVVELLQDATLRQKLALNARKLIEEKYTWEASVEQLERIYQAAIATHSRNLTVP